MGEDSRAVGLVGDAEAEVTRRRGARLAGASGARTLFLCSEESSVGNKMGCLDDAAKDGRAVDLELSRKRLTGVLGAGRRLELDALELVRSCTSGRLPTLTQPTASALSYISPSALLPLKRPDPVDL